MLKDLAKSIGFRLLVVVALAATSAAGLMYLDVKAQSARIETLQIERDAAVSNLAETNAALEINRVLVDNQRAAIRVLNDRVEIALENVINAPPEADGPIAPVLRDAIVASQRMWHDAGRDEPAPTDRATGPLPELGAGVNALVSAEPSGEYFDEYPGPDRVLAWGEGFSCAL